MPLDKILVLIFSLLGIAFTYWFFLMRKEKVVAVDSNFVEIVVDGGYHPEIISIPLGKTTTLNFTRKDSNSCLEEVIFGDFKIKKTLPLNQTISIPITPQKTGEYTYNCGMNMFHGKIRVV